MVPWAGAMAVTMTTTPDSDRIQNWQQDIDGWDLAAEGDDIQEKEAVVLINGKETGFADVKEGPAIYIGRENAHYGLEEHLLANPFPVSDHARKDSLLKYTDRLIYAVEQDEGIQDLVMGLYGKPLACWCLPKLCHGHVLNLYLVYRLHAGMDPQTAGEHIKKQVQNRIDQLLKAGKANPADYY